MASITLLNDKVTTIPLAFTNYLGGPVSPLAGDSWTAVSSSPSLVATIGGGGSPALILTPTVQAGPSYTVTINDAKGLPAIVATFAITPDPALATSMALSGSLSWTTASQAIPTNPGP